MPVVADLSKKNALVWFCPDGQRRGCANSSKPTTSAVEDQQPHQNWVKHELPRMTESTEVCRMTCSISHLFFLHVKPSGPLSVAASLADSVREHVIEGWHGTLLETESILTQRVGSVSNAIKNKRKQSIQSHVIAVQNQHLHK